jgi:2-oxoglutarate dehydrogenase E1 component
LEELAKGAFQEVIPDTIDKSKVDTVVFVSGKIYFEILEEREKNKADNVALVRLEQIYPFPAAQVAEVLKSYPKLKNLIWCQEEPKNMGAFQHIYFQFAELLQKEAMKLEMKYIGRLERASPATGSVYRHQVVQNEIIQACFKGSK